MLQDCVPSVRLVQGETTAPTCGRLEVMVDGEWGTVCDDGWTNQDAATVCSSMGLEGGITEGSAWNDGTAPEAEHRPIWLDNVACNGDEIDLFDCPGNRIGEHNCAHHEDVSMCCNADNYCPEHTTFHARRNGGPFMPTDRTSSCECFAGYFLVAGEDDSVSCRQCPARSDSAAGAMSPADCHCEVGFFMVYDPLDPSSSVCACKSVQAAEQDHDADIEDGQTLGAANGRYRADMQSDGNFVVYHGNEAIWSTETSGQGVQPYRMSVQADNNLVLYDSTNAVLWATHTSGQGTAPVRLIMQKDGNLVLYDATDAALWASDTSDGTDAGDIASQSCPAPDFQRDPSAVAANSSPDCAALVEGRCYSRCARQASPSRASRTSRRQSCRRWRRTGT
jgi:hypothetical protein